MRAVVHPRIAPEELDALLFELGQEGPWEYLAGEVVVIPPPGGTHAAISVELIVQLRAWQDREGDGGLLLAEIALRLGQHRIGPDVAWWTAARRPSITPGAIDRVPDFVVEILSPSTRENDLGVKRDIYEQVGVVEYWRVDPEERLAIVGRRGDDGKLHDRHHPAPGSLTSPLLPGLRLDLARLFEH